MKYDQHNFVVAVSAKSDTMTSRMNEVFEVKLALAQHFINSGYKFAIVGEDVVSNETRLGSVFNLIVSVIPRCEGVIEHIDEEYNLKNKMVGVISDLGYRCMIADEEMMSDLAKEKIQYLPKED